jgi:hypothetical protein
MSILLRVMHKLAQGERATYTSIVLKDAPSKQHRLTSIRVVNFSVNAFVLDDVLKSKVHEATTAALVLASVAIHQFLLTQGHQLASNNGIDALN